jgi:hypothetical protein
VLPLPRNEALTVDDYWVENVPPPDSFYWAQIAVVGKGLGVTGMTPAETECNIHIRWGLTIYGAPITPAQANQRLSAVNRA